MTPKGGLHAPFYLTAIVVCHKCFHMSGGGDDTEPSNYTRSSYVLIERGTQPCVAHTAPSVLVRFGECAPVLRLVCNSYKNICDLNALMCQPSVLINERKGCVNN